MKITSGVFGILAALCLAPADASAQFYRLTFNGTCVTTNGAGKLKTVAVTERTLIRECATAAGITNLNNLALVLHVGASGNGDTIDVRDITNLNGGFRCEVFKLFFQESYTVNDGSIKKFAYVYTDQNEHAMGSAVFRQQTTDGQADISGRIQYFLFPEGTQGLRICRATFRAVGQVTEPVPET